MNPQPFKKYLQYLIVFLVGGGFIYYSFKDTQWQDLLAKMQQANPWWLLVGMGISILSHWIRAYRATLLYDAMHYPVSTKNSFYAVLVGYMMNYFIPRAGEISRCASLNKSDNIPVEKSLGSVVTERLVDMVLLVLILGGITLTQFDLMFDFIKQNTTNPEDPTNASNLKWIILGALGLGFCLLFLLRKKLMKTTLFARIFNLLQGFADGLLSIRHLKHPILFIVLSVLIWVGYILMMYFCLFSMEATSHLSFADCLVIFAIGTIGVVLPAPGAGAGTYHFFVMQSLLIYGVAKEDGLAYATLVHGAQMILLILLGLIASGLLLLQKK